jgi:hypothetical protein
MLSGRFLIGIITASLLSAMAVTLASPLRAEDDWGDDDWADDWEEEESSFPISIHGFLEGAGALRIVDDPVQSDAWLMGEGRLQLDLDYDYKIMSLNFKADFLADVALEEFDVDVRDASIFLAPASWVELSAGRQILTWGTGDHLFLNDLFPKDFVSFFIGRADEYLKAPANSIKTSFFTKPLNIDFVWTPVFTPDITPTGERLSFFEPALPGMRGEDTSPPYRTAEPRKRIENGEFAARLYRTLSGVELALYAYYGFWPFPNSYDVAEMAPTYARLASYGGSVRGNVLGGIGNVEIAAYNSLDDRSGDDPTVANSQFRALLGYERELVRKLNLGLQYYVEYTLDHDALMANSSTPQFEPDETRHLFTARFTYLMLRDNLTLSLFVFLSPSDRDAYLRPSLHYKINDALELSTGFNLLVGKHPNTFFGQMENNTNAYARLRFSF